MLQQFSYVHRGVRESSRYGLIARAQNSFRAVAGEMRLALDLNRQVNQVDDPNFGDSGAAVDGKFLLAINDQGRIRNFNQQVNILRLRMPCPVKIGRWLE